MNLESVLDIAAVARPGYEIAAFKEAGLPVSLLTIKVLTQQRKPLGAIDEGVLRALDAGLENPQNLAEFLGLPLNVLTPVLARLNTSELLNYVLDLGAVQAKITLTTKGRSALEIAATFLPEEKILKVCMDMLTRKILFIHPNQLFKPKDVKEKGWNELPASSAKRIEVEDIPLLDFDKVLNRGDNRAEARAELLLIRRIERRELHFLPCVMLFYRNRTQTDDIAVAFWREDGPSLEHERKFRESGGPSMVGAKLLGSGGSADSKRLLESVIEQVADLGEVPTLLATAQSDGSPNSTMSVANSNITLQFIQCHEHPGLLRKGLQSSKSRLLIISPWIRDSVVDHSFLGSLEALLKNGVKVFIGYGLDESDGKPNPSQKLPISPRAEKDLKRLQKRYSNFQFVFIGNTHQKTLVSDDEFAVVTSFNWLSFKGDSRGKPRDEHGVVIKKKEYVEQKFAAALQLLTHGYSGQAGVSPPAKVAP